MRLNSSGRSPHRLAGARLKEFKPGSIKGMFAIKHRPVDAKGRQDAIQAATQQFLEQNGNAKVKRRLQRTLNQL